jgi:hypothetical protein
MAASDESSCAPPVFIGALAALGREDRQLREDVEILKRAAFFVRETR